ncbi:MAG TPA: glycosyltransferase family 2 protein [Bryobacteraceae bacterium]|nr:glycosyltransferase family 2 protein [Bryobacteraceae bacterium]
MNPADIVVVVPAYNESRVIKGNIKPLIDRGYTVVVVDDGSADGTWETLDGLPLTRIRHPINLGQGAALQTGMEYGLRVGARCLIHFDADGQHSVAQIPEFAAPVLAGECDVVLGSRFLRADDRRLVPFGKRCLLRVGTIVSWMLTGLWLTDTHNGFRALSYAALQKIRLREPGYAHATEILSEIRKARLRYREQPSTVTYSDYSRAKGQKPLNSVNILIDMLLRKVFQ